MFSTQLFSSEHLLLEGYDLEKDVPIESAFTYDLNYAWKFSPDGPAHPLTVFEVKKKREAQLKKANEENASCFYFAIRQRTDREFLGVLAIPWVFWSNREGGLTVLIGNPEKRGLYLDELLGIALTYAFEELSLYYLTVTSGEFEPETLAAYQRAGMQIAVRQKDMLFNSGRLWDRLILGMQQDQWLQKA